MHDFVCWCLACVDQHSQSSVHIYTHIFTLTPKSFFVCFFFLEFEAKHLKGVQLEVYFVKIGHSLTIEADNQYIGHYTMVCSDWLEGVR